ncbi:hypothetical protein BW686_05330 [Pseudomonas syringae]|uniref:DUF4123 domain-containing protein n=1 Tax=Pseudomonas syringae TaxID=317 RepID=A0A244EW19_PSESX|nr:DUF4123 domain-containing protein [Pseudomonas syringae]OUM08731.1 hypothetical protein BW686_05330 [Pseudomonas syringae]
MNQANYLLIDGLLRPEAIKQLYQRDEYIEIAPLYLGTQWSEVLDLGPVLVKTPCSSSLIQEWYEYPAHRSDACVFSSRAPLNVVSEHLRRFLNLNDDSGNSCLLRFADPLVMYYWLSSYSREHLSPTLGPIDQLWVQTPLHGWQQKRGPTLATFVNEHSQALRQQRSPRLGEPQFQAFEKCYRWLLEERIHEWLTAHEPQPFANRTDDQIDTWLKRAVDSGLEWGLVSEYALATWADICHDWGLDFVNLSQGPYPSWQNLYPQYQRLPPELRVNALDEYRQQLHKNTSTLHDR